MSEKQSDVARHGRHDRLINEHVHDLYMARSKPTELTVCPECGVVFSHGRWQWLSDMPENAKKEVCPACQRSHDQVPAGILILSGRFFEKHRDEIMHLVDNKVESEKAEDPMKRLMNIEDQKDGIIISFTDRHLPQVVGEELEHAYKGELDIHYTDEAGIVRVYWRR